LENTNLILIYRPETQIYGLWFHDPILKDKFYNSILQYVHLAIPFARNFPNRLD
jgi:hypothetical protein